MSLVLVAALACGTEPVVPTAEAPPTPEARSDTGTGTVRPAVPSPTLDAAAVAQSIEDATASGVPEPLLARAAYLSIFDHRDDECPGGQGTNLPGRFEGCTADSGWLFAGLAEYTGPRDPEVIDDFHLLADFNVRDADGRWFIGGGELDLVVDRSPGTVSWTGAVSGTWSWPAWTGWMRPVRAGGVTTLAVERTDADWTARVDGSMTDGTHAVYMSGLRASSTACDGSPTGTLELRDPSGYWYRLEASCGCGPVSWADGSVLGEACVDVDLSSLADLVAP